MSETGQRLRRVGHISLTMSLVTRFVAVPPSIAERIRRERRDEWGNVDLTPIRVDAERSAPCRICLRDALPGEEVLLFSYSPFAVAAPYRTVGPVFIHSHACTPHVASASVPPVLRARLLALRAHDASQAMIGHELVEGDGVEAAAVSMLADSRTRAIHVHFARAGCYACTVRRGNSPPPA
jgi:hypothetical protein